MSKLREAAIELLKDYDILSTCMPKSEITEWPKMEALRAALAEPDETESLRVRVAELKAQLDRERWRPASEHPSDTTEVLAWTGDHHDPSPVILHYWHPDGYDNTSEWRDQDANHVEEKDILCWRDIEPPEHQEELRRMGA